MEIRRVVDGGEAEGKVLGVLDLLDRICFPLDTLEKKRGWWWLGYENDKPICYLGARFEYKFYRVIRVGVLKQYRGRGYAKRLLKTAFRHAKASGYNELRTYTSVTNVNSMNALISCGYRPQHVNYYEKDKFLVWSVKW